MRTESFSANGISAIVQERTGRISQTEAAYRGALRRSFKELRDYDIEMLRVLGKLSEQSLKDYDDALKKPGTRQPIEYVIAVGEIEIDNPLGSNYSVVANNVIPCLARLVDLSGAPFHLNGTGRLSDADLEKAFDSWYEDDFRRDFWNPLIDAINKVDAPVTDAAEKPPEALTSAEKSDPLS